MSLISRYFRVEVHTASGKVSNGVGRAILAGSEVSGARPGHSTRGTPIQGGVGVIQHRGLFGFEAVAPGHYFEFGTDGVLDGDHGARLEFKCREHRAKLVNRQRIVAVH